MYKPMLAKQYDSQAINGWLMSEKLDGVRAIWTGKKLLSRTGKEFKAPNWFVDSLPVNCVLDGELWINRGQFQKTAAIARSHDADWSEVKFALFDCIEMGDYLARLAKLNSLTLPKHCFILEQTVCTNVEHLNLFENAILAAGGEGVIIRNPDAEYEQKRTANLLKVKRYQSAEVEIIGVEQGVFTGKYADCIGALVAKFNGNVFKIGSGLTDEQRKLTDWIGKTVTFSFFGLTDAGIPRHPAFVAVRDYE